jgi:hypothetical protein
MPPPRHCKLLLLYGGSHDAIKLLAYFGALFCVLNQAFLFISCFCTSSLCIFASMLLLCLFASMLILGIFYAWVLF